MDERQHTMTAQQLALFCMADVLSQRPDPERTQRRKVFLVGNYAIECHGQWEASLANVLASNPELHNYMIQTDYKSPNELHFLGFCIITPPPDASPRIVVKSGHFNTRNGEPVAKIDIDF